jgi:hypothetical protein
LGGAGTAPRRESFPRDVTERLTGPDPERQVLHHAAECERAGDPESVIEAA